MRVAIPRTEGYEVSEEGEVFHDGKPVKINSLKSGYKVVNIRFHGEKWRTVTVARLVLEGFVGPKAPTHEARHVDGNPANCHVKNLRWEPRGKNRVGKPHFPDTLGHELKDKRRKRREAKGKRRELNAMKRELARMARELGMNENESDE